MSKNTTYTPRQLKKLMETLEQQGVSCERFQEVLGSGLVSDIFHSEAQIANRIAVRAALGLGPLPSTHGSHIVDYSLSHEQMVAAGNYDWKNGDLTAERFPVIGEGKVEFEDTLFHFDRDISSEAALELIVSADKNNPWEPAKTENLLAYGAKNPEEQRKYPIIALGSVARVDGDRYVPYLDRHGSRRKLYLSWFGVDWSGYCRFLAVRKKVSQALVS